MATGMRDAQISHAQTKAMVPLGAAKLEQVLRHYLRGMPYISAAFDNAPQHAQAL